MFEKRLKILLALTCLAATAIVIRLFDLQVVRAGYFRERAERSLLARPKPLPFIRGSILDRTGEVLVSDEARWELAVDYEILALGTAPAPDNLRRRVRGWLRRYPGGDVDGSDGRLDALRRDIAQMWMDIALFTAGGRSITVRELRERATEIVQRVARVRAAVSRRRGFDSPVAEETVSHAVIKGLSGSEQIEARQRFARYPWIQVRPSWQRRFASGGEAFTHVLGRLGRVDADVVANDPNADDPFGKYRADERVGISGVERLAEQALRGRRGSMTLDFSGHVLVDELIESENGRSVTLTIHAALQRRLYQLLGEVVEGVPESSGGAAVVLDVVTREVLALVSYPSYDPNRFQELYPVLRDDTERLPLWFRTIASGYAPGSTVKPLICLSGLMNGVITTDTYESCNGYLLDDVRNRWRCWQVHGTGMRKAHGSINVVEALKGSCNIFLYRLGEKLGVDRICNTLDMVGVGKLSGISLAGEAKGINPTSGWLMSRRGVSVTPGKARHFAVGQGEILMTPLQVANLMATYASGIYRHVSVIRDAGVRPAWRLPASEEHWVAIRRGMYGVVNDPTGTAYKHAFFDHDQYVLCGKTGSASVNPRPTSYRVRFADEQGNSISEIVPAGSASDAKQRILARHPLATLDPRDIEVVGRWPMSPPPSGELHAHAWFGGFLQKKTSDGVPDWSAASPVAFALLVEYGSSGGRTSGPLAKRVAALLVETIVPELDGEQVVRRRVP